MLQTVCQYVTYNQSYCILKSLLLPQSETEKSELKVLQNYNLISP